MKVAVGRLCQVAFLEDRAHGVEDLVAMCLECSNIEDRHWVLIPRRLAEKWKIPKDLHDQVPFLWLDHLILVHLQDKDLSSVARLTAEIAGSPVGDYGDKMIMLNCLCPSGDTVDKVMAILSNARR